MVYLSSQTGLSLCKKNKKLILYSIFAIYLSRPDVWFVTTTQALQWVTDPKTLKQLSNYEPWDCKTKTTQTPKACNTSNKCALAHKIDNVTDTRYMETCRDCPRQYPWLGDSEGTGILGRDNYIYQTNNKEPQGTTDDDEEEQQQIILMLFFLFFF